MKKTLSVLTVLLFCSCSTSEDTAMKKSEVTLRDKYFTGRATVTPTSKGFRIALFDSNGEKLDQVIFNYQAYQLDTLDVNLDGRTEILLGLIKPTEFDEKARKRLFILRIDEGQLRPLWLGSKLCQQLVDFKASSNGTVQTLEETKNGNYAIGIYEWQAFGLTLIKYVINEKPYNEAITLFNS